MAEEFLFDPFSPRARSGFHEARRRLNVLNENSFRVLPLSGLYLREMPGELFGSRFVEYLDLSSNQLTEFSVPTGAMGQLVHLDLSRNRISCIGPDLLNLRSLEFLDLSDNNLNALPPEIVELERLGGEGVLGSHRLYLSGNPLLEIPEAVREQGGAGVLSYLRSIAHAAEPLFEAKLILCGEGAVGKSTLVDALSDRLSKQDALQRTRTHGVEISKLFFNHAVIADQKITVNAWDFGGQHEYRVTHQLFFSSDALYLLLFHAREGAARGDVRGWLRLIARRVSDPRVILVATHASSGRADLDFAKLRSEFPSMLKGFIHVDSLSGAGLDILIPAIAKELTTLPHVGRQFHPSWIRTRDALIAHQPSEHAEPILTFDGFQSLARLNGVAAEQVKALLAMLHNMGRLILLGK